VRRTPEEALFNALVKREPPAPMLIDKTPIRAV
jgi:hypothetical protein